MPLVNLVVESMTNMKIAIFSHGRLTPGYRARVDPNARLAFHVIRQALKDAARSVPVNINDIRPWAFMAGIPQRHLDKSFRIAADVRRRETLT